MFHAGNFSIWQRALSPFRSIRTLYPWLRHIFADGAYAGDRARACRDDRVTLASVALTFRLSPNSCLVMRRAPGRASGRRVARPPKSWIG
jgi:hypothetical protein